MSKSIMAGLLLCAVPVLAIADPGSKAAAESVRATVRLDDIDLGAIAGERAARERIHRAAVRLCGRSGNSARSDERAIMADCVHDAQAEAMEHLRRLTVLRVAVTSAARE